MVNLNPMKVATLIFPQNWMIYRGLNKLAHNYRGQYYIGWK